MTKDLPHSEETAEGIREREAATPLPPMGDRAIHSHKKRIGGTDNGPSSGGDPAGY
ncbi:MAG: hypothetical protein OHK0028_18330 [Deltaproteobacteria bacterium]